MDAFGSNDIRYLYYYLVMDIIIIHFSNHVEYEATHTIWLVILKSCSYWYYLCFRIKFPNP